MKKPEKSNRWIIFAVRNDYEKFVDKIKNIPELVEKIKYTQNKYVWTKAALGIMTTDLVPKLAMEECKIGVQQ